MSEKFEPMQPQERGFFEKPTLKKQSLELNEGHQPFVLNSDELIQAYLKMKLNIYAGRLGDGATESTIQGTEDYYRWYVMKQLLRDGKVDPYELLEVLLDGNPMSFDEDTYWHAVANVEKYNKEYKK